MIGFPTGRRTLGKVQPISKTTIPQNCLFDEFRRTYDRAYDLQFEGLQHLRPNPQLERSERGQCGVDTPHCCMLEREFDQEVAMKIESTTFGTITIDGTTYQHDVVVSLSGEVLKRKKKLSKKLYGTSHVLSKDEAKFLFEKGCDQVVIGSGQMGNVHLSPEAEAYFERKGCEVLLKPTPEAIRMFNRSRAKRIGLFHVTC